MDDKLFYMYLLNQKSYQKSAWSGLFKMPPMILASLIVGILSTVGMMVLTILAPQSKWIAVALALAALSMFSLYFSIEHFQITRSNERFSEYCDYCAKLNTWLSNFNINSKEKVTAIQQRISVKAEKLRNSTEKSMDGVSKWLQGFAMPIAIAVISAVIGGTDTSNEKFAWSFVAIILFAFAGCIIWFGAKALNFTSKRKVEQLEYFASDLQGILDTQYEDGIGNANKLS